MGGAFDLHAPLVWLRFGIAAVWLLFGLVFKALGTAPRHRAIVARVVGAQRAGAVLWLVVVAEIGLAAWMFSGRALLLCMAAQTTLIIVMNALELYYARDLLLSPIGMVCANVVFLSLGWYVALATVHSTSPGHAALAASPPPVAVAGGAALDFGRAFQIRRQRTNPISAKGIRNGGQ
jgi:hypothetical protein